MSREQEFISRHLEDLKRGRELCVGLQRGAVELVEKRQKMLTELRELCRRLTGSCRQMAHERGDDELRLGFNWLALANHYVDVGKMVDRLARAARTEAGAKKWLLFGQIAQVFEVGLRKIDAMANRRSDLTSRSFRPSGSDLSLPGYLQTERRTRGGIILPS